MCADGASVVIAGNGDAIFSRLMNVIGRPDLAADESLHTNAGRWDRVDELDQVIGAWTARFARGDVLQILSTPTCRQARFTPRPTSAPTHSFWRAT